MINSKKLICICILCILCLFILCQYNTNILGGNINDATTRKIKNMKKSLEEDLKNSEYNINKYNFKLNIQSNKKKY